MVVLGLLAKTPNDVLHHHDGVVDDEPHDRRHAAEGHDVETPVEDQEHDGGDCEHRGHRDRDHQGDLPVAEEKQQDHDRQHDADDDGIADRRGRGLDQLRLVVPGAHLDVRRERAAEGIQLASNLLRDLDGVRIGLLVDIHQDGITAVRNRPGPLRHRGVLDSGDVREHDDAGTVASHHHSTEIRRIVKLRVREDQIELFVLLEAAYGLNHIGSGNRTDHVLQGQLDGVQLGRVEDDLVLLGAAAQHSDAGNSRDGGDERPEVIQGKILEFDQSLGGRRQAQCHDRKHRGIHAPDLVTHSGWEARQHLADRRLHLQGGRDHVEPPRKGRSNLTASTRAVGADRADAGNGSNRLLERAGDLDGHAFRRPVPGVGVDHDAREGGPREKAYREPEKRDDAPTGEYRHHEDDAAAVGLDPMSWRHHGEPPPAALTAIPSARLVRPSVATTSPGESPR